MVKVNGRSFAYYHYCERRNDNRAAKRQKGRLFRCLYQMPHEEEILGKAYDARLMRRLVKYLAPYKWKVVLAVVITIVVSALGPLRPMLRMIAIHKKNFARALLRV